MLPRDTFDDLMIVTLKIFNVLIGNTIFYEIIMPLKVELSHILNNSFLLEYTRALMLL
jgi:hypothetical protein